MRVSDVADGTVMNVRLWRIVVTRTWRPCHTRRPSVSDPGETGFPDNSETYNGNMPV
jgi:hypothetical protein